MFTCPHCGRTSSHPQDAAQNYCGHCHVFLDDEAAREIIREQLRQRERLLAPTAIDKSTWGDGPWQAEPDRVEFEHAGLPCLLHRGEMFGQWCGYVGVAPDHPWHGQHYDRVNVDVHGGLTYSNTCSGRICHVPKPGASDDVWWFGFDCGHYMDYSPGLESRLRQWDHGLMRPRPVYRDLAFVRDETMRLAEQLAAIR